MLINGTYWDARVPKILTRKNTKSLLDIKPDVPGNPTDEGMSNDFFLTCPNRLHSLKKAYEKLLLKE